MDLDRLVRDNYGRIRTWFGKQVRQPALADDLTQETFACLIAAEQQHGGVDNPEAYLHGIARRVMLQHIRQKSRWRSLWAKLSDETVQGSEDQTVEQRDAAETLRRLVDMLSPKDRAIVSGYHFLGMTQQEISEAIRMPLATVSYRYGRAMERLQTLARRSGLSL